MLKKIIVLLIIVVGGVAFDQVTKVIAKELLRGREPIIAPFDLFRFQYVENTGAFLGLGSVLPDVAGFIVLAIIPLLVLLALLGYIIFKIKEMSMIRLVTLSLIFSGGIGNIIDRIMHNRHVVDFMNIGLGPVLRSGIFNVADLYLVAGVILAVFAFSEKKPKPTAGAGNIPDRKS